MLLDDTLLQGFRSLSIANSSIGKAPKPNEDKDHTEDTKDKPKEKDSDTEELFAAVKELAERHGLRCARARNHTGGMRKWPADNGALTNNFKFKKDLFEPFNPDIVFYRETSNHFHEVR